MVVKNHTYRNYTKNREVRYCTWFNSVLPGKDGNMHSVLSNVVDITNLKLTELALADAKAELEHKYEMQAEQLRYSKEQLLTAYTLSPDAVIVTRLSDGIYLELNQGFTEITGYEYHEAIGKTATELNLWVNAAERGGLLKNILADDKIVNMEAQFCRKDGSILTGLVCARLIEVDKEQCIMTFTRDITDLKLVEDNLKMSKAELKEAQRIASAGSWLLDIHSGKVSWSDELCRIHGYTPSDPLPVYDKHDRLFVAESLTQLNKAIDCTLNTGQPYKLDLQLIRPDGSTRWVTAHGEAIHDPDGTITALRGTTIDITDRKNTELELENSALQIQNLYNYAPCGYHSLDKDGIFVQINDTELNWLGYDRSELIGKMRAQDLMTADSLAVFANRFPKFKQGQSINDLRLSFYRKDRSILPVILNATPIMDENGDYLMSRSAFYDITDLVQIEERVRRLNLLYLTLSKTGKTILQLSNCDELYKEACIILVNSGGLKMAWIGLIDNDSELLKPVAAFGSGLDYLENIRISTRIEPEGMGPTGKVLRDGGNYVCKNFANDPNTLPWRYEAKLRGYLSSASFAINLDGAVIGALTMYADQRDYFDEEMVELLIQMQADICFALDNISRKDRQIISETKLHEIQIMQADMATELSLQDEQIRLNISTELHDHIGQSLILGQIKLGCIDESCMSKPDQKNIADTRKLIGQVIKDVRSLTLQLTPPVLANAGLEAALEWLCRQIADDYGLQVSFSSDNSPKPLLDVTRSVVYQSARELLVNVAKHAQANQTQLSVVSNGQELILTVEDDGVGFDQAVLNTPHKGSSFGLFNISRQIKRLGGMLSVCQPKVKGSKITITMPLLLDNEV
jgi:PAS domain S-box-containing protein